MPTSTPRLSPHRLRGGAAARRRITPLLLLAAGTVTGGALGLGAPSSADEMHVPARVGADTIIEVSGDAANGFSIQRLDGTTDYPPTDSEARAECGEYDRKAQRVRCRSEVRQWYADLADLRDTIDYYQRLFD